MMVTMSNHGPSLEVSLSAPSAASRSDFFWRSLPGRVSPSVIYNNNGWSSSNNNDTKRQHLSPPIMHEDADADSNGSGTMSSSSSSGDEQPRKTSLVSRQLAKIRSSMRLRKSASSATSITSKPPKGSNVMEEEAADDRVPLVPTATLRPLNDTASATTTTTTTTTTCHNKFHKKRYRSASTPTLCCCASGPNRRCSQPLAMRTPVKNHFQALARVFKRNVARKKSKSTSLVDKSEALSAAQTVARTASTSSSHSGAEDRKECAKYLRTLTNNNETRPRLTTVLRDERAHEAFRLFLKGEYSDENINFWSDVESYKTLQDVEKRDQVANTIFSTYLQTDATCEINISYETKAETVQSMKALDATTFNRAQNEILFLMESDAFKRFLSSILGGG